MLRLLLVIIYKYWWNDNIFHLVADIAFKNMHRAQTTHLMQFSLTEKELSSAWWVKALLDTELRCRALGRNTSQECGGQPCIATFPHNFLSHSASWVFSEGDRHENPGPWRWSECVGLLWCWKCHFIRSLMRCCSMAEDSVMYIKLKDTSWLRAPGKYSGEALLYPCFLLSSGVLLLVPLGDRALVCMNR